MSGARPLIIGVVGGSSPLPGTGPWAETTQLARELGELLAGRAVLLTGGKPAASDANSKAVHENAMAAAIQRGGLAIGVLPRCGRARCVEEQAPRWLRVETGSTSPQRNFINGTTPDGLIALAGGPGTLSEVLVARRARRPVVFLRSLVVLLAERNKRAEELREFLTAAYATAGRADEVESVFDEALEGEEYGTPAAALAGLLEAIESSAALTDPAATGYPADVVGAPSKMEFERAFRDLTVRG